MARTKASVGAKIASGKSNKARCSAAPPPSSAGSAGSSEKGSRSYSGGNPVCPRETPKWQKPITRFFYGAPSAEAQSSEDENLAGPSTRNSKRKDEVSNIHKEQEGDQNVSIESNDDQEKPSKSRKSRVIESDDEDSSENVKSKESKPYKNNVIQSDDEDNIEKLNQSENDKELQNNDNDQSDINKDKKIENDDSDQSEDLPKNQVLDETIILEPLTGEDSHKIDEYYLYKNKGKGKKTKSNKENIDLNNKNAGKRCLEEVDDTEHATKKVKVASVA